MVMIVAWQALNALTYPKRKDFSSASSWSPPA